MRFRSLGSACGHAALVAMRRRQRRISVSSRRGWGPGASGKTLTIVAVTLALGQSTRIDAQRGAQSARLSQPAGRGNVPLDAPFDPTGYWVSLISDEWRYRMLTPPKGNVDYVPISAEGRGVVRSWDPEQDERNGEQCKGYGAVGVMRLPTRLHITWTDVNTLRIDTDTGTQTRVFHFGASARASTEPTWQGYSVARWEFPVGGFGPAASDRPRAGQLKVVTTHLRPGYLRKNGVPYGVNAVLTEYFALLTDDDGMQYLAVTTLLEDPQYLLQPWVRTSQFRKQANGTGWNPTPCSAR